MKREVHLKPSVLRWALAVGFGLVILFIPLLMFPFLLLIFFFYLTITNSQKRSIGISLFRTGYALLGITIFPLLYLEPLADLSLQLSNKEAITVGTSFVSFLTFYRVFFMMVLPIGCYLAAYLLSILDIGGYILPLVLLFTAIPVMLMAAKISPALMSTPMIILFALILLAHILFFSRKKIRSQFQVEQLPMGVNIFYYIYSLLGFIGLYFYGYILEDLKYFVELTTLEDQGIRLVLGITFAVLCLLSSSLLSRLNVWGYRIPVVIMMVAILMRGSVFLYPLLACHLLYFSLSNVRYQFIKSYEPLIQRTII